MPNDEPVRLLLAESGTRVGGTERVVWELATRLPAERFAVRVWLSDAPGVDELAESLAARDLPVDRMPELDSRWAWGRMLAGYSRLRRSRVQLLHVHHVEPAADPYVAPLARAAGVPHLVVSEHGADRAPRAAIRSRKRRELQQADAITAVCGSVADSLVRDFGVPRSRVRLVANGADSPDEEREWPAARRLRDDLGVGQFRPLWVCAARLEPPKGHAVLLEALERVKASGLDFIVVLAGEGSLGADLRRRVEAAGLGAQVRFVGEVETLGPLLMAADACVLPSLWDGLPLTLLEALARGRPVAASRVGGIPDVIEDGNTGRLVPPGDAAALASALEDFHRRPDAARHLGRAGAERVRTRYTWPRIVEAFEAVYDEVLGLASFAPTGGTRSASRGAGR